MVRHLLAHPRLSWTAALVAILLCTPSLWLGLHADDYVLRLMLADPPPGPEWARPAWRMFSFFDSEATVRHWVDVGGAPWWAPPDLRLSFFRPLAGLTHWLDFRVWPPHTWLMHVQSLLWFGACLLAAAAFYRRLLRPSWLAGLAALLFALDDAHSSPVVWLANRNAILCTLFALLALVAHDRWRRDGWRPGRVLAPLSLLLGLLGGEMALAGGAYLLAYALFVDEAPWRERLSSLVPFGLVGCAWMLAYRSLGFGATGSALYIDPLASPADFARAVVERAPLLLFGQWALPSHLSLLLSEPAAHVMWLVACGLALVLVMLLTPLVRHDRVARFLALGMLLSLLPACSTFPHDRLLFMAGVGGAGLLAQLLGGLLERAAWLPRARAWRAPAYVLGVLLSLQHLLLSPLGLAQGSANLRLFGSLIESAALSLPSDDLVSQQTAVIVQTPTAFLSTYGPPIQMAAGRPAPRRLLVLGSSIHAIAIERQGDDTLLVRPAGGYLRPSGGRLPDGSEPHLDLRYLLPRFDGLYRNSQPMQLGQKFELPDATIDITALTPDGRPAEARFRFRRGLHDPSLRWLGWREGAYVRFELPAAGRSVLLPPATLRPR